MSRKKSKKPRPDPSLSVVIATKRKAAIGQLESAILLWFNEADPISILVMASNSLDCYTALGNKAGQPSLYQIWLDAMPASFRERSKYIQDFAKHGFKDLEEDAEFSSTEAEGLMIWAVDLHERVYDKKTPLMTLFSARVFCEHPEWTQPHRTHGFLEGGAIQYATQGSRKECLERCLPILVHIAGVD
jgi:hypothetical protein